MKKMFVLASAVAVTLGMAALVSRAEDKPAAPAAPAASATTAPSTKATTQASATPVNKKCPVSGDAVDPKVKTVQYDGKTIGFCCEDCVEQFNDSPEQYIKMMDANPSKYGVK